LAVSVTVVPAQIEVAEDDAVKVGTGLTFTLIVVCPTHPTPSVPTTV
jgi:hypothetical protein